MKPAKFEYTAPRTTAEALSALAEYGDGAKVLAGGQSLVPLMNMRLARPEVIVDINEVAELDYVRWGTSQARRAWVEPGHVLNTRSREELLAWVAAKPARVAA